MFSAFDLLEVPMLLAWLKQMKFYPKIEDFSPKHINVKLKLKALKSSTKNATSIVYRTTKKLNKIPSKHLAGLKKITQLREAQCYFLPHQKFPFFAQK